MNDLSFLDTSSEASTGLKQGSQKPSLKTLQFKAGKTQERFANAPNAADGAGFSYYDKELPENQRVVKLLNPILVVVEGYIKVQGATKDGERYLNYYSNYIKNTKQEKLYVRMSGVDKVQHEGLYADIKKDFPQGVGFTIVLIVYEAKTNQFFEMALTSALSKAIEDSMKAFTKARSASPLSFLDSKDDFFAFVINGLVQVDKDLNAYKGKGDCFFVPNLTCGKLLQEKQPKWFEDCFNMRSQYQSWYSERKEQSEKIALKQELSASQENIVIDAPIEVPSATPAPQPSAPQPQGKKVERQARDIQAGDIINLVGGDQFLRKADKVELAINSVTASHVSFTLLGKPYQITHKEFAEKILPKYWYLIPEGESFDSPDDTDDDLPF